MIGTDDLVDVPSLPLDDPILVFTLALVAFLVGPLAIRRLGQPGIVGIVLIGAIIGPGGTGLVEHGEAIVLLGNVGLIYLLFTVGLELDLRGFSQSPESAALFGLTSFGLTFIVGVLASISVLGLELWPALLLSAVFSSHTLLAYPVVNQYGVTRNRAITAVFGGILFTDTLALIVLAVAMGAIDGGLTLGLGIGVGVSLIALFGGVWLIVPPIARWFFKSFSEESYFEFLFVIVVFFTAASAAELLDLSPILGAFIAGVALNPLIPDTGPLRNRIEFVGNALLIPFFLLHVGMLVDFGVIFDGIDTLKVAAMIIGVMFSMKAISAWLVGLIQGYDTNEVGVLFGLTVGQAAAALAITLVGYEVGLFSGEILNAVVLMLLVTAVVSPWVTRRYSRKLALDKEVGGGDDEIDDPRVLLPLSHYAERQRQLFELACALKNDENEEPVHALTVVNPDDDEQKTQEKVTEAQERLDEVSDAGDEAEIPVDTETRVNHNPASGIVRGAIEVQADLILMGWDAKTSFRQRVFGSIIDHVLRRTRLLTFIARLDQPVNTTENIYVVLPEGIDHHEGFFETVHYVKRIADRFGASVTVLPVGAEEHRYDDLFNLVEPEIEAEFESGRSWDDLFTHLEDQCDENDLVVALTPRQGKVGWDSEIRTVPNRLAKLPSGSFVTIHPRNGDPDYDRKFLRYE